MTTRANDWKGYYRGFHIARAGKVWEVRTGIARTVHADAKLAREGRKR